MKLLLLPGMDGTGELFTEFMELLPAWIEPLVVSYPTGQKLSYDLLSSILHAAAPHDEPFVILAESFSSPLAVRFAATAPQGLRALVLCAGFVSPPRIGLPRLFALITARFFFAVRLPNWVCRRYLVGHPASQSAVDAVRTAVSGVSSQVLAHRLRSILSIDATRDLRRVSVPLLYMFGTKDRLLNSSSSMEIRSHKPDAQFASIDAPHLILQAKPREALNVLMCFIERVCDWS